LNSCAEYITTANKLIELTNTILEKTDESPQNPFPILANSTFREKPSLTSNKGYILVSFK